MVIRNKSIIITNIITYEHKIRHFRRIKQYWAIIKAIFGSQKTGLFTKREISGNYVLMDSWFVNDIRKRLSG